jgi:hypothetical protein
VGGGNLLLPEGDEGPVVADFGVEGRESGAEEDEGVCFWVWGESLSFTGVV